MSSSNALMMKKAWLSQHMADTKRLWADAVGGAMPQAATLYTYLTSLRAEWDRLAAEEPEAAGWRE